MPPFWIVIGYLTGGKLVQSIFPFLPLPHLPIFHACSFGKFFLAPILCTYQIEDGDLIRNRALAQNTPALQATHVSTSSFSRLKRTLFSKRMSNTIFYFVNKS